MLKWTSENKEMGVVDRPVAGAFGPSNEHQIALQKRAFLIKTDSIP